MMFMRRHYTAKLKTLMCKQGCTAPDFEVVMRVYPSIHTYQPLSHTFKGVQQGIDKINYSKRWQHFIIDLLCRVIYMSLTSRAVYFMLCGALSGDSRD